jgi:hypothetical protein
LNRHTSKTHGRGETNTDKEERKGQHDTNISLLFSSKVNKATQLCPRLLF